MKKFDVVVPRKYDKDGETKTAWKNVGTLTYFEPRENREGGYILELNMFPNTDFKVFEQKPRDQAAPQKTIKPEEGEVSPEDVEW